MALDIGEKRVGMAVSEPDEPQPAFSITKQPVSDPDERVASPVCVLTSADVRANAKSFRLVIEDWEPDLLLCGLPYTLAGEEGPQAQRIREFADVVGQATGIPIEFADERLSSAEAKRSLREKGLSEKAMRGKVDMIAASLFLQAWLDARRPSGRER